MATKSKSSKVTRGRTTQQHTLSKSQHPSIEIKAPSLGFSQLINEKTFLPPEEEHAEDGAAAFSGNTSATSGLSTLLAQLAPCLLSSAQRDAYTRRLTFARKFLTDLRQRTRTNSFHLLFEDFHVLSRPTTDQLWGRDALRCYLPIRRPPGCRLEAGPLLGRVHFRIPADRSGAAAGETGGVVAANGGGRRTRKVVGAAGAAGASREKGVREGGGGANGGGGSFDAFEFVRCAQRPRNLFCPRQCARSLAQLLAEEMRAMIEQYRKFLQVLELRLMNDAHQEVRDVDGGDANLDSDSVDAQGGEGGGATYVRLRLRFSPHFLNLKMAASNFLAGPGGAGGGGAAGASGNVDGGDKEGDASATNKKQQWRARGKADSLSNEDNDEEEDDDEEETKNTVAAEGGGSDDDLTDPARRNELNTRSSERTNTTSKSMTQQQLLDNCVEVCLACYPALVYNLREKAFYTGEKHFSGDPFAQVGAEATAALSGGATREERTGPDKSDRSRPDQLWCLDHCVKEERLLTRIMSADGGTRIRSMLAFHAICSAESDLAFITPQHCTNLLLLMTDQQIDNVELPRKRIPPSNQAALQNQNEAKWQRHTLKSCIIAFMTHLRNMCRMKIMPNFFIQGNNMFSDAGLTPEQLNKAMVRTAIYSKSESPLYRATLNALNMLTENENVAEET